MERREFIKTALAAAGAMLTVGGQAAVTAPDIAAEPLRMARIRGNFRWADHPTGEQYLLQMFKERTSINADCSWHVVDMNNLKEMVKYPILFVTSPEEFRCTDAEARNLKEYIMRGGFLLADDCVFKGNGPRDKFFTSVKELINRTFDAKMVEIPPSDDLFRCFHNVPRVPVMQGKNDGGWGLYIKGRLAVFLDAGDIHCGWESRYRRIHGMGSWFSYEEEGESLDLGVNILVYMMSH